jgi:hypothetical protein
VRRPRVRAKKRWHMLYARGYGRSSSRSLAPTLTPSSSAYSPRWRRRSGARFAANQGRPRHGRPAGCELGGWAAGSERSAKEAAALAERTAVMAQLAGLSAHKAAAELNRRKITRATGGKWYAATVIKLRGRLEA